jgi:hypothetical protein
MKLSAVLGNILLLPHPPLRHASQTSKELKADTLISSLGLLPTSTKFVEVDYYYDTLRKVKDRLADL